MTVSTVQPPDQTLLDEVNTAVATVTSKTADAEGSGDGGRRTTPKGDVPSSSRYLSGDIMRRAVRWMCPSREAAALTRALVREYAAGGRVTASLGGNLQDHRRTGFAPRRFTHRCSSEEAVPI